MFFHPNYICIQFSFFLPSQVSLEESCFKPDFADPVGSCSSMTNHIAFLFSETFPETDSVPSESEVEQFVKRFLTSSSSDGSKADSDQIR